MSQTETEAAGSGLRQTIGLWLGLGLAIIILLIGPPDSFNSAELSGNTPWHAWTVCALAVLMAVWWGSEAIPIPVTALLPLTVLPIAGVMPMGQVSAPYMHPVVVLLLGGFIIARAIERWNLHTRIALNIVSRAGSRPSMLVAGFMAAAAILSMWISNTATSLMMMPIALSVSGAVLGKDRLNSPFTYALLLGIAWACSIGGLGTPVGTPTNLIVIRYLNETTGLSIGFTRWMLLGTPTVCLLVPAAWFVLTRWAFPLGHIDGVHGQAVVRQELAALGPMTTPERRTLIVFAFIAALWIFRRPLSEWDIGAMVGQDSWLPLAYLNDYNIAVLGVILCFLIPAGAKMGEGPVRGALLDWPFAERIPWGVVLLFGGGMALANAMTATGLGTWLGIELSPFGRLPPILLILLLTTVVIFVTEVTSNIATAAALMPVLGAVAIAADIDVALVAAPLAMAASCAFMLPMATGPNAVVFATGHVSLPTMARAGIRLNLIAIFVITATVYALAPMVFRTGSISP
ncbi:DASS family sodium-coupled anion symporter [Parvularcula sp. LCG005]|uniref:SLC13 family permease n=1 Tax=Parvularcula sp. LCG005 TaxID=3078805 RepID=UPI0029422AB4|nr:DASS family sodium-coupled anion symporter [Parvularcula sp. LCG005]WOI54429.1 DASS family sodium-coupled anion symporter [Parvularcula sp. LCG005]